MAKRWLVGLAGFLAVLSASAGSLGAGGPRQQSTSASSVAPANTRRYGKKSSANFGAG